MHKYMYMYMCSIVKWCNFTFLQCTQCMYTCNMTPCRKNSPVKSMLTPASHLTSIGLQQPSSSGDESNFCDESGETSEKKLDMKSMGRECLKVFDFDMSGDEDDVSEGERDLKRTRVDQGIPCKPAASGKQSLLPQYARGANVRSSSQCAGSDAKRVHQKISNPKAARDGKPIKGTVTVSARKKAPASTNGRKSSSEYDIRSTISKLSLIHI